MNFEKNQSRSTCKQSKFAMSICFLFNTIKKQNFEIKYVTQEGGAISQKRQNIGDMNIMDLYQTAFMYSLLEEKDSKTGETMDKLLMDLER